MKHIKTFESFVNEKKPAGAPDWHDSDAPDAEGRFKELNPKDLAAWLIKTRNKDVKKITGSINQQIVFNRNEDPEYAKKMEKTRKEVYKQLGREDLLEEGVRYSSSIINGKTITSNWAAETDTEAEFIKAIKELPKTIESINIPIDTSAFNPNTKKFKGPITSSVKNSIIRIIKDMTKKFKENGDPIQQYSVNSYYGISNLERHQNDRAYIKFSTQRSKDFGKSMSAGKFGPLD
jgi:uncharacterized protein (UPF0297 family)